MSDKNPLISVIVASYNYQDYIKETLNSLVNQTCRDFEVIIVDDGSSDNSIEVIKGYTQKYDNFYLYTHEKNINKGLSATIQLGLSKAKGEYIAFCESDDYWDIHSIEEKINFLKQYPEANIIVNGIQTLGENHLNRFIKSSTKILQKKSGENLFKYLLFGNKIFPTFSAVMIKKSLLETLDFNPCVLQKWLDLWLWRQAAYQNPIFFLDKKLTYWRIHKDSYISEDKNLDKKLELKFLLTNNEILHKKYNFNNTSFYILNYFVFKNLKHIFSIRNSDDKKYKIVTILGFDIFIKK